MTTHIATPEHEVAYQDVCNLVRKHADRLTALELLAVASNMLGKLIALQDQSAMSSSEVMAVVARNIETGNQQAIEEILLGGNGTRQ